MFTFYSSYSSWDKYQNQVAYDEDSKVSLSSYRRLDQLPSIRKRTTPLNCDTNGIMSNHSEEEKVNNHITVTNGPQRSNQCPAVEIRGARFTYGKGKSIVYALRGINITVPEGGIYGLLGPSGCGKTTLLRCVVGRLKLTEGTIRVFGNNPAETVPGSLIGYMPQELALFPDFTICETLTYFGRLYRIKECVINQRVEFLLNFLDLPDKNRLVGNLSGGQKRRVSLAASLIHSPPLLILDEPTVGVDPLLRQSIWDYLVALSKTERLSVIITTHYIEEARAANVVGLMRFGRLLIESSPNYLLKRYSSPTLEEVFLKLCELDANGIVVSDYDKAQVIDEDGKFTDVKENKPDICSSNEVKFTEFDNASTGSSETSAAKDFPDETVCNMSLALTECNNDSKYYDVPLNSFGGSPTKKFEQPAIALLDSTARTSALFWKNITRLRRNLPVLLFQFLLPSIEVILFCVCIGRDPFDINVAVYNQEAPGQYSNWFLRTIDNRTVIKKYYDSYDDAINAVKHGHAWGAIIISKNFTSALQMRVLMAGEVDNETVEASSIKFHPDMTNQMISLKLYETITYSFIEFGRQVLRQMGQSTSFVEIPVVMEKPIYGERAPTFTEFMAPGVVLSIAFLAAVALTALAFVMERKEGLLERSLVAGVSSTEFMLSHVLTQLLVLAVQVALLLIFTFLVFEIPSRGPFIWVIVLTLLQGSCGMSFGLMISALCTDENAATMLALGSFYPNLLLSGTVWPTQAMPAFIRYFSYILPQTIPIEAMRYILSRGWSPVYSEVALGFGITIIWIIFFLILAVIIFRAKK